MGTHGVGGGGVEDDGGGPEVGRRESPEEVTGMGHVVCKESSESSQRESG